MKTTPLERLIGAFSDFFTAITAGCVGVGVFAAIQLFYEIHEHKYYGLMSFRPFTNEPGIFVLISLIIGSLVAGIISGTLVKKNNLIPTTLAAALLFAIVNSVDLDFFYSMSWRREYFIPTVFIFIPIGVISAYYLGSKVSSNIKTFNKRYNILGIISAVIPAIALIPVSLFPNSFIQVIFSRLVPSSSFIFPLIILSLTSIISAVILSCIYKLIGTGAKMSELDKAIFKANAIIFILLGPRGTDIIIQAFIHRDNMPLFPVYGTIAFAGLLVILILSGLYLRKKRAG